MSLDFYMLPLSPACRPVHMVLKELDIDHNLIITDTRKNEHMADEYVKRVPEHKIPSIVDDGFVLWESRAIMKYLVDKFAPGHHLYPKDLQTRATVDRWLFYCGITLCKANYQLIAPIMSTGKYATEDKYDTMYEKLAYVDSQLAETKFLAGEKRTIADLSIYTRICIMERLKVDIGRFKNISRWREDCRAEIPYDHEITQAVNDEMSEFLQTKIDAVAAKERESQNA